MSRRIVALAVVAVTVSGLAASVVAQGLPPSSKQGGTLMDRLDEFGRNLLDGVLPSGRKTQTQPAQSRPGTKQAGADRPPVESTSQRAGTAMQADPRYEEPAGILAGPMSSYQNSGHWPPQAAVPARATNPAEPPSNSPVISGASTRPLSNVSRSPSASGLAGSGGSPGSNGPMPSQSAPLYARLKQFGSPAFPAGQTSSSVESAGPASGVSAQGSGPGHGADALPGSTPATEVPALAQRNLMGGRVVSRPGPTMAGPTPAVDSALNTAQPAARPTLAKPATGESGPTAATESIEQPATAAHEGRSDADSAVPSRSVLVRPDADRQEAADTGAEPPASLPGTTAPRPLEAGPDVGGAENLLFARQSPILSVETVGPRRITVGKPSTYVVTMRNSGQVAADQLVVAVALPDWAEVLGAEASKGGTAPSEPGAAGAGLRWDVGRLGAGEAEKLTLQIIPRQSQPFDLAVRWSYSPAASQAMIEVQEPKLEMRLEGPREVLFGQNQVYRLELMNSGTGDADNVAITFTPIGTGQNVPATHNVGTVKAGQKKAIDLELTARQTGTLTIRVDARGDGGVAAHLAHQVAVFRPALAIDVQAPPLRYVGTDATCLVRVSNPGNAPAQNVTLTAAIPPGAEYVSSSADGRLAPDQRTVTWNLKRLEVGAEVAVELTCRMGRAGLGRLEVASSAEGGLTALRDATIRVEAIADLELNVTDPPGPIPVDAEVIYQVRVRNRGTKSADQVEVVAYFSQGIEPTGAEGGRYQTAPGQVVFDPIRSLAAGQEMTFQIRAQAETAGNHVCRVEVYCKPLGTRLVGEETTYFYGGPEAASQKPVSRSAGADSPASKQPIRTAAQRLAPAAPKNE